MGEIIVLFMNGDITWKVYAIRQNPIGELFASVLIRGLDSHLSRHKDGTFHVKTRGEIGFIGEKKLPNLDDFTGIELLPGLETSTAPTSRELFTERKQPYDKTVLIDVRKMKGPVELIPFLIDFLTAEPKEVNALFGTFDEVYVVKEQRISFGVGIKDMGNKKEIDALPTEG